MEKSGHQKIKICMMLPKFHIGGAEVQVLEILRKIDRSKFDIHLCLFNRGLAEMEMDAAKYASSTFFLGFKWRYLPFSFLKLVKYLQDNRFDVVHAHLAYADLIGRIAAWFAGVPVRITTEHGKGLWKSSFQLMIERWLNGITDIRICVSGDIMDIRRRREHTPDEKLVYIPNAVDTALFEKGAGCKSEIMEKFGWKEKDPLILSVGRIVEAKNYPLLAGAFKLLLERIPEAKCIIAGDGRCRDEVERVARDLGIADSFKLPGASSEVPDLLDAADIFVLSSLREGLPVSLLEAMAARTPIVSTDVGGIGEAVKDGESALLVPSGEREALAVAMEKLLRDSSLREDLAAAAFRRVEERFSIKSAVTELSAIYSAKLSEKRRKI